MEDEMRRMKIAAALIALGLFAGCAAKQDISLDRALAGQSQKSGSALDRAIAAAAAHPFGSQKNPVRAAMPPGQHAYLRRLRCSNGQAPQFARMGNFGLGVYGNIIDGYAVDCGGAAPGKVEIYMDMYHAGYVETRPVPGFTIVPD
jgi:hypothetical protein